MQVFCFSKKAKRMFENLDDDTKMRIQKKFQALKNHPSIYSVLEPRRIFIRQHTACASVIIECSLPMKVMVHF